MKKSYIVTLSSNYGVQVRLSAENKETATDRALNLFSGLELTKKDRENKNINYFHVETFDCDIKND